jgi:hypothetical protein
MVIIQEYHGARGISQEACGEAGPLGEQFGTDGYNGYICGDSGGTV